MRLCIFILSKLGGSAIELKTRYCFSNEFQVVLMASPFDVKAVEFKFQWMNVRAENVQQTKASENVTKKSKFAHITFSVTSAAYLPHTTTKPD